MQPLADIDIESLPPLDLGFQEIFTQEGNGSLPPLNLGFQEDNAASDEALPPVMQEQHANLPPLNLGFEEPHDNLPPPSQEALPPLNLGFREPLMDLLSRAHDTMDRAIDKLAEFDVEGHPARAWVRTQIQACEQMQVLYRQMVLHCRSRLGVYRTLHMICTVGPEHVRE
jgi:hypothetical protein